MKTLVKMSMKLLVRTKIIWLFLVLMPVLSTRILKTNVAYTSFQDDIESLVDIDDADTKVAYYSTNGEYVVKVYDASGSELSDYLVDRLANSGMFVLCRVDLSGKDIDDTFITVKLMGKRSQRGYLLGVATTDDDSDIVTVKIRRELLRRREAVVCDHVIVILAVGIVSVLVKQ